MMDKLRTIERNFSLQLSYLPTTMPENLTDYYQALANLVLKITAQISALEQNVSAIEDALTSHVTNSTQSIADALSTTTQSFKDRINVPSSYISQNYWVGANDISTEGSFVWNDGTPLPTSSELWNRLEPNNANENEDCVEIYISAQTFSLNDNNCLADRLYICEYDL